MKNIVKSFLFLAFLIPFISCNRDHKKPSGEKEIEVFETPEQIISLEEADSLYLNYKRRRASYIPKIEAQYQEDGEPFLPTEFVSFDIKVLEDYIGYVKQEAKKGGTSADSIRIYLGNYGSLSEKYNRKNTVFLIPTAQVGGDYGSIYIDGEGKAKLVREWINEHGNGDKGARQQSKASIIPSLSSPPNFANVTSLALNFGQGGPPPKTDF